MTASSPGSDVAAEMAAALAASSIFYKKNGMTSQANKALKAAKSIYDFADKYRGKYSDSVSDAAKFYK